MDKFLVNIDEFKILNEGNPLGYIRDINTCMGILIHYDNYSVLFHLAAFSDSNIPSLKVLENLLKENAEVVEIFKGPNTNKNNISIVIDNILKNDISYVIKDVFIDNSNQTSLGYDYVNRNYYRVKMNMGNPEFLLEDSSIKKII